MPLSKASPALAHVIQNLALVTLSLFLLPPSTFVLVASLSYNFIFASRVERQRKKIQRAAAFKPKVILVTGVGMSKGLSLARLFYRAGHTVIGADFEPFAPVAGHVSRSVKRFYRLDMPLSASQAEDNKQIEDSESGPSSYATDLLHIVEKEEVDIWVSCSGVSAAVEDGEAMELIRARTSCQAIQFDTRTTQLLHEKDSFIHRAAELGLGVPETHPVADRQTVKAILDKSRDKYFILKTVGVDDAARSSMTLLPRPTPQETDAFLRQVPISPSAQTQTAWIMQEFVRGEEFCTHALVVRGRVRAFVACPSAEMLMHYRALSPESPLSLAMLEFTKTFARKSHDEGKDAAAASSSSFTGHLSFDFLVKRQDLRELDYRNISLYPIECNPRCHTAVTLFSRTPELVRCYFSVLEQNDKNDKNSNNSKNSINKTDKRDTKVLFPKTPPRVYWISHDLVTLILIPALSHMLLFLKPLFENLPFPSNKSSNNTKNYNFNNKHRPQNSSTSSPSFIRSLISTNLTQPLPPLGPSLATFIDHLLRWKEGTFEVWDPLPWWWLNHVYWPLEFVGVVARRLQQRWWWWWARSGGGGGRGKWWSRVNVSTNKKFEC